MITEKELNRAIAELENGQMTYSNCEKLACFYTIRNNLFLGREPVKIKTPDVSITGNSEFIAMANNKKIDDVFKVIDELMETIKITNTRLYDGVIRKLDNL